MNIDEVVFQVAPPNGGKKRLCAAFYGQDEIISHEFNVFDVDERERYLKKLVKRASLSEEDILVLESRLRAATDDVDRRYEAQQAQAAEQGKLQGEEIRLSWPEPWPEPVELADVLDEVVARLRRHVVFSAAQADGVALWLAWSYCIDRFDVAPLLAILSPTRRCGKTTLGRLVGKIAPRCLFATNIRPAALYRTIQESKPTLICDELDGNPELQGEVTSIINGGYTRDTAFVIRCVGEEHQVRQFSTWCAKVLLAIGKLPGTVADRSITITMQRKPREVKVERFRKQAQAEAALLARKLMRWREDNAERIDGEAEPPNVPDNLNDRQYDCWLPLLTLADLAGRDWPRRGRRAAAELSGGEAEESDLGVRLLMDIRAVFDETGWAELTTKELLDRLAEIEDAPWATLSRGRPVTARRLALLLRPFGVEPVHRKNGNVYRREAFLDVFSRYIPLQTFIPSPDDAKPNQIRF